MLRIEVEREEDGRWLAEVPALPGVLVYGGAEAEARAHVVSLALRVIADRIDNGEPVPEDAQKLFAAKLDSDGANRNFGRSILSNHAAMSVRTMIPSVVGLALISASGIGSPLAIRVSM